MRWMQYPLKSITKMIEDHNRFCIHCGRQNTHFTGAPDTGTRGHCASCGSNLSYTVRHPAITSPPVVAYTLKGTVHRSNESNGVDPNKLTAMRSFRDSIRRHTNYPFCRGWNTVIKWVAIVFGSLVVFGGLWLFVVMEPNLTEKLGSLSEQRIYGFILFAIGLGIVIWARIQYELAEMLFDYVDCRLFTTSQSANGVNNQNLQPQ